MGNSGDSSSPNNSIPSFPQNPPTTESDQIQDQTMSVVDATTQEGGSHGNEGKKEDSENIGTEPPSKVLDSCKTVAVSPKKDEREEPGVGVAGEKRKSTLISSLCIDLQGALPPPISAHSMLQEEGGKANKKVKVGEGSLFDLNQEIKDGQDNEEKPKMKVQEAVVVKRAQNNEVAATEKAEVEPAEVPQNDAADRIVRDIDLNQLAPEYEEDNWA